MRHETDVESFGWHVLWLEQSWGVARVREGRGGKSEGGKGGKSEGGKGGQE